MEINSKLLKQIDETRYLTAENAWRYRTILRFFYLQYEKMKYWMYKEELFEELKQHEPFFEYSMDALKQDLEVLVHWRNLIPVQDTAKVSTVDEFKNKQFRYQLSEYSVEIERLTLKLENLYVETASLEPSLLERIRLQLENFTKMSSQEDKIVGAWWSALNIDFKTLNQNYQDYIRDFYSLKAEELMKTREFLIFKDKFIEYLRDFIKGLQYNTLAIESILKNISMETEASVFQKVFTYECSIPRLDFEIPEQAIRENIHGRWDSLRKWFLGDSGRESEAARLLDITNEIIRKITRFAAQISESRNSAANRKEEYRKLCQMFLDCREIKEAHKLSAVSFGIFNPRHVKADTVRGTESINSSIFDEEPTQFVIKPRVRNYREKTMKTSVSDHRERKAQMLQKVLLAREEETRIMNSFIQDHRIEFAKLPLLEPHVRTTLLRWLSKGINSPDLRGKTEDGRVFRIIRPPKSTKPCLLSCTDGMLEMPSFVIEFEEVLK